MSVKPLYNRILIRPIKPEEVTKGGIILPVDAQEQMAKAEKGEVIAVGTGTLTDHGDLTPLSVKVGDIVIYGKYAGTEIRVDDENLLIMPEHEIFAVEEREDMEGYAGDSKRNA